MEAYLVSQLIHYCNITLRSCYEINTHVIDYYDFTFVLEGEMTYYADGEKYVLHKNDGIFMKPGTLRAREPGSETVSYVSFNFRLFPEVNLPFSVFLPKCITSNIRRLISVYPTSHISNLYYSREKCMLMLNYILYELLDSTFAQSDNGHIMKILKYIDAHIHEKLSLQSISMQINLSREYTSYIFKREMKKTLTEYINERKMLLAKELIVSREMSLNDVAEHLGFEDYNYFCRLYKKQFGMPPGAARKEIKNTRE